MAILPEGKLTGGFPHFSWHSPDQTKSLGGRWSRNGMFRFQDQSQLHRHFPGDGRDNAVGKTHGFYIIIVDQALLSPKSAWIKVHESWSCWIVSIGVCSETLDWDVVMSIQPISIAYSSDWAPNSDKAWFCLRHLVVQSLVLLFNRLKLWIAKPGSE